MSASVEQMFSVNKPVWWQGTSEDHGQALILDDYPQTWAGARTAAGLDWEPVDAPVYSLDGIDAETGQPIYREIPKFKQIQRSDTGATLALTAESYPIIGHGEFGEIFEAILETDPDHLKAETGGVLEGGRKVWMLIRLDEPIAVRGDGSMIMPYLAITARHDAKGGVVLRATAVRIVCANTFRFAELEGERTGATYTFLHRGNWRDHADEARQAIRGVRSEIKDYVEYMEHLTGVSISQAQEELFITEFVPSSPLVTDRVARNVEQAREAVRGILASETVEGAGIRYTAAGLVQAAGEYLDHARDARSWETKIKRSLIRPEPLKARAAKLALEVAAN